MSDLNTYFDVEKIANHWSEGSNDDYNTMLDLYQNKSYTWALFLGHISIEKLLKASFVKKHFKHAPFTHNLYRLAELNEYAINSQIADYLDTITTFNMNARYDDYKKEFSFRCTKEYTNYWINNIKFIRKWIIEIS